MLDFNALRLRVMRNRGASDHLITGCMQSKVNWERRARPEDVPDVERAMGTESSHANQLIFLAYPGVG